MGNGVGTGDRWPMGKGREWKSPKRRYIPRQISTRPHRWGGSGEGRGVFSRFPWNGGRWGKPEGRLFERIFWWGRGEGGVGGGGGGSVLKISLENGNLGERDQEKYKNLAGAWYWWRSEERRVGKECRYRG